MAGGVVAQPAAHRQRLAQAVGPGAALGIAQREYGLAPRSLAQEFDRLETLVGSEGDLADRHRRLSEDIRYGSGKFDDVLVRHLILTTLAKIEVDQPTYPPYLAWKNEK